MWSKVNKLTLLTESFFGLPWILVSILFAYKDPQVVLPSKPLFWALLFLAFFSARILGMSLNRVIDYEIDGKNKRTKSRPLQLKIISRNEVKILIIFCTIAFVSCCYLLSPLCFIFSPLVLFLLYGYSYTKRFSALCHFFLGSIHFFGPIFAWMALSNSLDIRPVILGGALWLFIAANDMVYAIQDLAFDLQEGLKSVPVVLGVQGTMWLARLCQTIAIGLLIILGLISGMNFIYFIGVGLIMITYLYYHFYKFDPMMTFRKSNILGGLILLTFTLLSICIRSF